MEPEGNSVDPNEFWSKPLLRIPTTFRQRLRFRYDIWKLRKDGVDECNVIYDGRLTGVILKNGVTVKQILNHVIRKEYE